MNVNIQTVRFDADSRLVDYVKRKLEKLTTFHDRIIKVYVFLKLDNVVHNIKDKIAEIRIHVPRHEFFVKSTSKSFEESFDEAFDSIVNQIKRKKQKQAAWKNYQTSYGRSFLFALSTSCSLFSTLNPKIIRPCWSRFRRLSRDDSSVVINTRNLLNTNKKFLFQNFCNYQIPLPLPP